LLLNYETVNYEKIGIVSIVLAIILFVLALFGIGGSTYGTYKNYTRSSEFQDSYNIRIQLSTDLIDNTSLATEDTIEKLTKQSATSFSNLLFDEGFVDYSVYYGVEKEEDNTYSAYIDVNVPIFDTKDSKGNEVNVSELQEYFDLVNSSRLSLIYAEYNVDNDTYSYSLYTSGYLYGSGGQGNERFSKSNVQIDASNNVCIKLNTRNTDISKIYDDFETNSPEEGATSDFKNRVYVIKDLPSMINFMNHAIQFQYFVGTGKSGNTSPYGELT